MSSVVVTIELNTPKVSFSQLYPNVHCSNVLLELHCHPSLLYTYSCTLKQTPV